MSGSVENSCHNDDFIRLVNFIDNAIGKTFGITPTNILLRMSARIEQGIFRQRIPNVKHSINEICPSPGC